jgi:hypothetical protein
MIKKPRRLRPQPSQQGPYSSEDVRHVIERFLQALNAKHFFTEDEKKNRSESLIQSMLEHGDNPLNKLEDLENEVKRSEMSLRDAKEKLIEAIYKIDNLYRLQIEVVRQYGLFVDLYSDHEVKKMALENLRKTAKNLHRKWETRSSSMHRSLRNDGKRVWKKGKKAAAIHCLGIFHSKGDRKLKLICADFLAKYVIEEDTTYSVAKFANYVSTIKSEARSQRPRKSDPVIPPVALKRKTHMNSDE